MPGPFHGILTASSALRSFQRALDVTGHNIANVNTAGYSRQTVDFSAQRGVDFFQGKWFSLGGGVTLGAVNRVRVDYLDQSMLTSNGQLGRSSTLATGFERIERIYGEPGDGGISSAMGRFFDSWSGLASNPADPSAREQVRLAGQTLTDRVRGRFAELTTLEQSTSASLNGTFTRIDELAQQIASLNREIQRAASTGGSPNDLMDQRNLAADELGKLVPVNTRLQADGTLSVFAANYPLVDSGGARSFPKTMDLANGTVTDGNITLSIRGGELAGHMGVLNEVRQQKANLDNLANTLRTQVNTLHRTGINQFGISVDFFNDSAPQTGAIDFDLSSEVKPDSRSIASGISNRPGDGGLARSLSQLRDSALGALGNQTFSDFFSGVVSKLANDTAYYKNISETESNVQKQIENQRQSVSGVSLDDEMANMMKFQRSYQAAARTLTVMDQMTEDLIGMLRR